MEKMIIKSCSHVNGFSCSTPFAVEVQFCVADILFLCQTVRDNFRALRRIYVCFAVGGVISKVAVTSWWNPGVWWKRCYPLKKHRFLSLSLEVLPPCSPSSLSKLFCLVWNFGDGLWTLVHHLPKLPASWRKPPFLST